MTMNRRQWLQMLGVVCIPPGESHSARQAYADLLAVTQPGALPPIDGADMARIRDGWGPSPWHCSVTGCCGDLDRMLAGCCNAVARHQRVRGSAPATAVVVLRGNGAAFCRVEYVEVFVAIRHTLHVRTDLWFGAARDAALVDALRVTVVMEP